MTTSDLSATGMSREQELILRSAGTRAKREAERKEFDALLRWIDWGELTELLAQNRLLPTLGPRIVELAGEAVGESFQKATSTSVEAARRQDALLLLIGQRLAESLRARSIIIAPLKGPALGETLYGEPGRRLSSDIDLLVPCERLEEAIEAVGGLGYAPPTDARGKDGRPLLHFAMAHERGELPAVELHWRIHWYEERFARERLLPPVPGEPDWRPQPVDELAALLLYYARDGFSGLRQATDLGAWWDRFGDELTPGDLDASIDSYPELRPAIVAAARVAERTVGLPADRILRRGRGLGPRGGLALRLADPRPYATPQQLFAEIGLIDGLLTPRGGLRAFLRRQVVPPRDVIREHVERAYDAHVTSTAGYATRVLGRYAIAIGRLLRVPGTKRLRFGPSPVS